LETVAGVLFVANGKLWFEPFDDDETVVRMIVAL
jgi:hypothetical protein